MSTITKDHIIAALRTCIDPELKVDVWTLGLIYDIQIPETKENERDVKSVYIKMTLTSPGCPYGSFMIGRVNDAMRDIGFEKIDIDLVLEPPWEPPEEIKLMMGV